MVTSPRRNCDRRLRNDDRQNDGSRNYVADKESDKRRLRCDNVKTKENGNNAQRERYHANENDGVAWTTIIDRRKCHWIVDSLGVDLLVVVAVVALVAFGHKSQSMFGTSASKLNESPDDKNAKKQENKDNTVEAAASARQATSSCASACFVVAKVVVDVDSHNAP